MAISKGDKCIDSVYESRHAEVGNESHIDEMIIPRYMWYQTSLYQMWFSVQTLVIQQIERILCYTLIHVGHSLG